MIKYVFNLIRKYIVYLKKELINQMKELIIETLGDKSNKVDDKINKIFEDIPTKIDLPKQNINDFLKDDPLYEIKKRGSSKHSQVASAALFPETYDNVKYIGTTGEYYDIPMYLSNDLTRPIYSRDVSNFEDLENKYFRKTVDYPIKMQNSFDSINFSLDGGDSRHTKSIIDQNDLNKKIFDNDIPNTNNPFMSNMPSTMQLDNNKTEPTIHLSKLSNKVVGLLKKKSLLPIDNQVNNGNDIDNFDFLNNDSQANTPIPIYDIRGEVRIS